MARFSIVEKLILALVLIILIIGYILFYTNVAQFESYVQEDGIVEWLTVLGLVLGCIVCIRRFFVLRKNRSAWFLIVTFGLALMLFFAAGEEISWGQRIFHIKSSEFFKERNSQGETNLHNLVVDGVKLNKLIFSIGLTIAMGIYLLVFPILYKYHNGTKRFIDRSGIPLPRIYQVFSMLLVFVITSLLPHEKKAEMLEAGIALLFFLVIRYPGNLSVFDPSVKLPKTS
jgi:cell division protein FtsW (lipid II flippase)